MNIPQISQASLGSINQRAAPNQSTSSRRGSQISTGQGSEITALATQSSPDGERSPTKSILKDSKSTATPDSLGTASTVNRAFCPYHRTKSHDLEDCQKFRELDFSQRKDFLFKKGFCFNCASSNKHISKHCDKGRPQCKICGRSHVTALHDPSRPENNSSQASSACTRVCKDRPRRSCARIILLKVSDQSDPLKETLTYAVLDDQSTDVFITDALQSKLNLSDAEVNLQVNTIVGTNTVRMRRVPGLQIQDINSEYSPVKVPYASAQPKIPLTHSDIATPDIVRQWDHLKDVADEVHYRSDIDIGVLIGRNVPTAFQPLKVIYGEADEPWAEKYKFGWTIIGPVCLDKAKPQQCSSVSVNHVTVQREELPDSCIQKVKLNCCVKPPGFGSPVQAEVHSFSDASQSGIGQVSYLRTVNSKGEVHVSFLIAKSRVAPIKPISIPRMEPTAAVVSVNVTKMLQSELNYENLRSVYYRL